MKKNLIVLLLAFFAVKTASSQATEEAKNYDIRISAVGGLEKVKVGNYLTTEKKFGAEIKAAWKHLGGNISIDISNKITDLGFGYALKKSGLVFEIGPNLQLYTKQDSVKTIYAYLGIQGFVTVEKDDSYEFNFSGNYCGLLKKQNTDWNEAPSFIKAEFIKKFRKIIGIGINLGYINYKVSEPKPKANQPNNNSYTGKVENYGTLKMGLDAEVQFKPVRISVGPVLVRDYDSYKSLAQPKQTNAGDWLLNWEAKISLVLN